MPGVSSEGHFKTPALQKRTLRPAGELCEELPIALDERDGGGAAR
jgi:hypothetical protein